MPSTDDLFPGGLRGLRYGEVILVHDDGDGRRAEIFNTLGLNDCPPEAWDALDAEAIAAERGVAAVVLNGPRRWLLDAIETVGGPSAGERRFDRFGSLDAHLVATVELGTGDGDGSATDTRRYTEIRVARRTVFRFRAGSEVYELHSPTDETYVMQAMSLKVVPDQSPADLAGLGAALGLPEGWTYSVRTLDEDLDLLSTDGIATVVQDERENTYQRIDAVTREAAAARRAAATSPSAPTTPSGAVAP